MGYRKRIILLALFDTSIIIGAVLFAYFLRFDFRIRQPYFSFIPYVTVMHIILIMVSFNWAKIYRRVWQYASIGELISLIKATTMASMAFYLFHMTLQFQFPQFIVPRSIYPLSWVLTTLGIATSRLLWRMFRDTYLKIQPHHRKTLIVGAGKAGALIAKELKHSTNSDLYPVAFIDDDPAKQNLEIIGLPVVGSRERIPEVVNKLGIERIIIAIPSASRSETAKILDICKTSKANIKILPRVSDLVHGNIFVNMIREVSVEDLLGRDPVEVDLGGIANYVTGQVVLITGAGGSIGSEICRQILPFNPQKLVLLGHGENSIYDIEMELSKNFPGIQIESVIADIQDYERMREVFSTFRPMVVFHAAAHKHVPLMEKNPVEAVKNNILGTKNIAECSHDHNVSRFVMVSTDKAVNPTSVMGVTKRVAEMVVQGLAQVSQTKFVAVRFGNVLGSRGSVIPLFKKQIQEGGPVTVTHPDMVRYFMTIPEAVQLVIQAGALAKGGEIFILDMGKPVKIAELARDLIRLSGLEPDKDIRIIYTGIRPGEKLFEEILTSEEGITATKHDRIFVGKPTDFSLDELQFIIKKLQQTIKLKESPNRSKEIKDMLRQIVPGYKSNLDYAIKEFESSITEMAVSKDNALESDNN